jgi:hypothetical protein
MRMLFTAFIGLASTLAGLGQERVTPPPHLRPEGLTPGETRLKDAPKPEAYQIPEAAIAREGTLRDGKRSIGFYLVVPTDKPLQKGDDPVTTDVRVGVKHYSGKQLVYEARYLANPRTRTSSQHGFEREWYPNGALKSELLYDQGLLNGTCKHWNEKGEFLGSYELKQGKGTRKEWFDDGKLLRETPLVNNHEDGKQITYYPGGQVLEETHFKAGELHGVNKRWQRDGTLYPDYPVYFISGKQVSLEQFTKADQKRDPAAPNR